MSLVDYGRVLLRRGWIMILLAILAAVSAYLLSSSQTRIYRATQVVLIQPSRNDLGLTEATTRLLNSYVVYLNSSRIADRVIDALRLDMIGSELLGKATITSDRNNLTIQIDVDLPDCAIASSVAQAWGEQLVLYRQSENQTVRQEDRIDALLADAARCPTAITPNVPINTIAGAGLGLILGGVLVFVLEYLESSVVHRREDLERAGTVVLATIPASGRDSLPGPRGRSHQIVTAAESAALPTKGQ
ncbi:MAG: Wzz/FepE/Etk N-terminal domain-containing protein [Anaerolinea sp.]|nr:Wzz/FepE/Etk N-terminal domain-containing protein [Anaerolinea sp.]